MKLLLDTCTFLWIISGSDRVSEGAKEAFTAAENDVFLSSVSAWEISVKYTLGKLPLPLSPERFVPEQRSLHRIESLDLTESSVFHLHRLPALHRDPFDRMLVCQAIDNGLTILTPDNNISAYPLRTLW